VLSRCARPDRLLDEPVGRLERGDAGQRELLGQAVLERAEGALGASPRLGGVRKGDDALKAQLDEIIERKRDEIQALLERYGVPMVSADAQPPTADE
jgi:hypothetical protein